MNQNLLKPQKVFVAFVDILGFKDLVTKNDTPTLIDLYNRAIIEVNEILQKFWETSEWRAHVRNPKVKSLTISDSMVLYTEGNGLDSFLKIMAYVHAFINYLFAEGLPVRGAISFGDFVKISNTDNNILLGKSIVQAYELEKNQDWAGCVIDEECFKWFDPQCRVNPFLKMVLDNFNPLTSFEVPFKDSKTGSIITKEMAVINWPVSYHETVSGIPDFYLMRREVVENAFSAHNKDVDDDRIKRKIKNTVDFYNFSIGRQRSITPVPCELTDEIMERYKHKDL